MLNRLKNLEAKFSLPKAALIVGAMTLLSRLMGLLRDRLFASHFGAGDTLDVYYAAFRIPDLVFNLLILGTLSVAFIPVFAELLFTDKERANKNANTILNASFLTMSGICAILLIFIHPLTKMLVPGFSGEKLHETVLLTRLFLLSPVIFTLSNVFTSILNAQKKFIVVGLAPILYNFGIIFGLLYLYPKFGILGLGFGVIFGALLHLLVQIPEAIRNGYFWQPALDLKDQALRKMARLFVPRIFGVDNSQISLLVSSIIGSFLASGSIAIFNLANNLQAVPLGVFAISYAVAAFPVMSEQFAKRESKAFAKTLSGSIVQILFFMIPISILMLLLRAHLVRLVFGAGKFNWNDTILTFNTLGFFALSLFSQSLTPLLSRAFYARQNTKIPVIVNLLAMALNVLLAYALGKKFGVVGMAAAFSIASILNAVCLFLIIRFQLIKSYVDAQAQIMADFDKELYSGIFKILLASTIMGAIGYGILYLIEPFLNTHTGFGLLVQSGSAAAFAILIYLGATYNLGLPQAITLLDFLKRKLKLKT